MSGKRKGKDYAVIEEQYEDVSGLNDRLNVMLSRQNIHVNEEECPVGLVNLAGATSSIRFANKNTELGAGL